MMDWKETHKIIVALASLARMMVLVIFRVEPSSSVIPTHIEIIVALAAAD